MTDDEGQAFFARIDYIEKENESLRQQLTFESHKCSKCGTNLGLLHEDACPLCNCRQQLVDSKKTCAKMLFDQENTFKQQLEVASYWGPRWEKEYAENKSLRQQLAECQARERAIREAAIEVAACSTPINRNGELARLKKAMPLIIQPSDSTALDAMLKQAKREVLLEAAKHYDAYDLDVADELRRMAKELK